VSGIIKECIDRVKASGDTSPGQWNLAADLMFIAAAEAEHWTNRADDATRIPDMLMDCERYLRQQAAKAAGGGELRQELAAAQGAAGRVGWPPGVTAAVAVTQSR
jgi:hypothetical protein